MLSTVLCVCVCVAELEVAQLTWGLQVLCKMILYNHTSMLTSVVAQPGNTSVPHSCINLQLLQAKTFSLATEAVQSIATPLRKTKSYMLLLLQQACCEQHKCLALLMLSAM